MEPLALRLLHRLRGPFGRALGNADFRVGLDTGNRQWLLYGRDGLPGVSPKVEGAVDGWVMTTVADLERMLGKEVPDEKVRLILGERAGHPRRRQAIGLLVAAALGWAGPWPDPSADLEHQRLLRRAILDLRLGPEDRRQAFLPEGAPLRSELRIREEVDGECCCTEGLSDLEGFPEFWCRKGQKRRLRMAALAWREGPFRELQTEEGLLKLQLEPILLPRGPAVLAEVRDGDAG